MTIKKSAKEDFLARKLDSFDWIKKLSSSDLDDELSQWEPKPVFHTPPFLHQKASFVIGSLYPDFLYLLDLGLGKTKLMLDLFAYEKACGNKHRALVLVPNVANIENWVEQVQEHAPHLEYVPLFGDTKIRQATLEESDGDIFIINYDGFVALVTDLVKKKKGKGRVREINEKKFNRIEAKFGRAIFDESTHFKNHRSLTYRVCNKLASRIKYRYALTGTPFGRDPIDLWAQFRVVDRGATLGKNISLFRDCFFNEKENYFSSYPDYVFDKKKEKQLYSMLKNRSVFYDESECTDLPLKVYTKRFVTFPVDTYQYYSLVVNEAVKGKKELHLMKNAYIQMRQLASGFLGAVDDETGEKVQITFKDNPKLDDLEDLITALPKDRKMVVYHEYLATGIFIANMLDRLGVGYERLYGGTKDQAAVLRSFKSDKKCQIFVVNNKSGAFGLNLQVANYVVFFETPDSPIIRRQAEKRCHRPGQKANHVFYFDLVMKNSIDVKLLKYLREGKDLFDALVKGKEKWGE